MPKTKGTPTPIRAWRVLTAEEQAAQERENVARLVEYHSNEIRRRLVNISGVLSDQVEKINNLLAQSLAQQVPLTRKHVIPIVRDLLAMVPRMDLEVLVEEATDRAEWQVMNNLLAGKKSNMVAPDTTQIVPGEFTMAPGEEVQLRPNSTYLTRPEAPFTLIRLGSTPNAEVAYEMANIHASGDMVRGNAFGIYYTKDDCQLIQVKVQEGQADARQD